MALDTYSKSTQGHSQNEILRQCDAGLSLGIGQHTRCQSDTIQDTDALGWAPEQDEGHLYPKTPTLWQMQIWSPINRQTASQMEEPSQE